MSTPRSSIRIALAALFVLGLGVQGCKLSALHVELPDFDTDAIQGLWVWRQATSGAYQRWGQIVFGEHFLSGGDEIQRYTTSWDVDGTHYSVTLQAIVERPSSAPGDAEMSLAFGSGQGSFKVSAYNAAGESPLSTGVLVQ